MKEKVALIFGGEGVEREISEISAQSLCRMIDQTAYEIIPIGISPDGAWYAYYGEHEKIGNGAWLRDGKNLRPTFPVKIGEKSGFLIDGEILPVYCAIPCLHGNLGEDGTVQGALRTARIKYVGQDVYSSAITSDKAYTKLVAEHLSVPTAKWTLLTREDAHHALSLAEAAVGFPMFLKPARLGSSIGAHPVYDSEGFYAAYRDAYALDGRVLVEELIPIKYELECAYLSTDGEIRLAPYGKILSDGAFYDFGAKYDGKLSPKTSAEERCGSSLEADLCDYATRIVDFVGIRDLARIDFFVTTEEKIFFNEINVFPGMTESSLYPKLTEQMGLKKGEFINLLIEAAHDRRF